MKRTILALACALPIATGAFAFTDAPRSMVNNVDNMLQRQGFDVDVNDLTDRQISAIFLAASSSEGGMTRGQIRAILTDTQVSASQTAMIVNSTQKILNKNGFSGISVENLSDSQISEIYLIGTSRGSASGKRARIRATLNPDGSADIENTTMYLQVERILEKNQVNVEIETLTDAQIAGIFLAASSAESESQKMQAITSILQ